jgi:hypothetical protein
MFSRAHASFFALETREFVVFIRVQFLAASRSSCHAKDAVDNDQVILVLMAHSLQPNSEQEELNAALLLLFVIVLMLSCVTSCRLYCGDSFVKGYRLNDGHHYCCVIATACLKISGSTPSRIACTTSADNDDCKLWTACANAVLGVKAAMGSPAARERFLSVSGRT